jgi:hypothetical protein
MDMIDTVDGLLDHGEFYYANCIVFGRADVVAYQIRNHKIEIERITNIDANSITDLGYMFSTMIEDSMYAGGEGTAHGSFGFFYKKTGADLDWLLTSTISNPFVAVHKNSDDIEFLSSSGQKWIVHGGDIGNVTISKYELT